MPGSPLRIWRWDSRLQRASGILFARIIAFVGCARRGGWGCCPDFISTRFPFAWAAVFDFGWNLVRFPCPGVWSGWAAPRAMPPIFPGGGAATVSVFVDGVFLERLTGLFAYGISGKSRSLIMFSGANLLRGSCDSCSKALFSLIFSPEIWSFTNFDLLLRSVLSEESRSPERWVSGWNQ